MHSQLIHIGCAGWALRQETSAAFPPQGTHLERYAHRFNAVEINSSFYRPHQHATYARWSASVPLDFSFAVKMPRAISHTLRLENCDSELEKFFFEKSGLAEKRGPLLLQLPPSLAFVETAARTFFTLLRQGFSGSVVCEPRHASWFGPVADAVLADFNIARAAADPAILPAAAEPGGSDRLRYYRLHGSPRMYYSAYGSERLAVLAGKLHTAAAGGTPAWCIFDNTAAGAAITDALEMQRQLAALAG